MEVPMPVVFCGNLVASVSAWPALPPMESAGDDRRRRVHQHELYERHRAAGTLPLTDDEGGAWG
ncbi:hypothetical protein [Brachybacterium sp. GPGPB12]|uniref:hypothetical protein n=1 Tax=Brachybacterium sp. GPGPB12 TaxID=3023517 RepID=UPI00313448BD